jgi:hypothetical protein
MPLLSDRVSAAPRAVLTTLTQVALSCIALLTSCQLDSKPRFTLDTNGSAGSPWMPQTASAAGAQSEPRDDADDAMEMGTNAGAGSATSTGSQRVTPDAGVMRAEEEPDANMPSRPATTPLSDAGSQNPDSMPTAEPRDAGAAPPSDSSQPVPDAGAPQAADAGANTLCRPGAFTGAFSGEIEAGGTALGSVTGTVHAQLVLDVTALYLEFRDARIMGMDQDGNTMNVALSGAINCLTDQIEDGRLESGVFHYIEPAADITFVGTIAGTYARDPHSVLGTWSVAADASSLLGGRGTFSLVAPGSP